MAVHIQYGGQVCEVLQYRYPTGTIKLTLQNQKGEEVKVITIALTGLTDMDTICIATDHESQIIMKELIYRGVLRPYGYTKLPSSSQQARLCNFNS